MATRSPSCREAGDDVYRGWLGKVSGGAHNLAFRVRIPDPLLLHGVPFTCRHDRYHAGFNSRWCSKSERGPADGRLPWEQEHGCSTHSALTLSAAFQ